MVSTIPWSLDVKLLADTQLLPLPEWDHFLYHSLKQHHLNPSLFQGLKLRAHWTSVIAFYNMRWLHFHRQYLKKMIKLQTGLVDQLVEFLLYLKNLLKLKGSTIAGYLSITKMKLALVPELHAVIKGFKQHDQI